MYTPLLVYLCVARGTRPMDENPQPDLGTQSHLDKARLMLAKLEAAARRRPDDLGMRLNVASARRIVQRAERNE